MVTGIRSGRNTRCRGRDDKLKEWGWNVNRSRPSFDAKDPLRLPRVHPSPLCIFLLGPSPMSIFWIVSTFVWPWPRQSSRTSARRKLEERNILVFPAASKPNINILISLFPNNFPTHQPSHIYATRDIPNALLNWPPILMGLIRCWGRCDLLSRLVCVSWTWTTRLDILFESSWSVEWLWMLDGSGITVDMKDGIEICQQFTCWSKRAELICFGWSFANIVTWLW